MSKFKKGDKVLVEGVVIAERGHCSSHINIEFAFNKNYYINPKNIHPHNPAAKFAGQWVNYGGEKWWCVGVMNNGDLLICKDPLKGVLAWEMNECHYVEEGDLTIWQEFEGNPDDYKIVPTTMNINGHEYRLVEESK